MDNESMQAIWVILALLLAIVALAGTLVWLKKRNARPYDPGYLKSTGKPGEEKRRIQAQKRFSDWLDTLPPAKKEAYKKDQLRSYIRRGYKVDVETLARPDKTLYYRATFVSPDGTVRGKAEGDTPHEAQIKALP